ncbi:MAG TPA: EamA family transporter [Candidatus Nanoarchaeia archaeon]|nr:EamA family transporter [Candidatus Nanoarchaeia archaeon]
MISISWVFALLGPFIWGFMNTIDKYIVSHKAKSPLSFAVVAGIINIVFGGILALFLSWKGISYSALTFSALAGAMMGLQIYWYYSALKKADASYVLGLYYIYPIMVVVLSVLFLNEVLSWTSYIGVLLVVAGATMITTRLKRIRMKLGLFALIGLMITGALSEFFVKISVDSLPLWHGIAVTNVTLGVCTLPLLFRRSIREKLIGELKNIRYGVLSEVFTFAGILSWYFAMQDLPVTIVASVSAAQPLAVVIFERMAHRKFGKITRDLSLKSKLIPLLFIVLGIIILYVSSG